MDGVLLGEEVVAEKTDEIYCVPLRLLVGEKEGYRCTVHGAVGVEALSKDVDVKKVLIMGEHKIRRASIHPKAFSIVLSDRPTTKKVDDILQVVL